MSDDLATRLRRIARGYEPDDYGIAVNLDDAADEIDRLTAEVERLTEALRFYADPAVYKAHPHGPAFDDRDLSHVARAALKEMT